MVHSIQLTFLCCPFCFTGCLKVIGLPRCGEDQVIANASGIGMRHEGTAPNKQTQWHELGFRALRIGSAVPSFFNKIPRIRVPHFGKNMGTEQRFSLPVET